MIVDYFLTNHCGGSNPFVLTFSQFCILDLKDRDTVNPDCNITIDFSDCCSVREIAKWESSICGRVKKVLSDTWDSDISCVYGRLSKPIQTDVRIAGREAESHVCASGASLTETCACSAEGWRLNRELVGVLVFPNVLEG